MNKKIAIACDHRGVKMKESLKAFLNEKKFEVIDYGAFSEESSDYPDFVIPAAESVSRGECGRAIGICYTGIGSSIVANKVRGVRASLCHSVKQAELTRAHNDSNMLIIGSGFLEEDILFPMVKTWLNTSFDGGRHEIRVNKIKQYEESHGS